MQKAWCACAIELLRFYAFVLNRSGYLKATWHASTRLADVQHGDSTGWLDLEVRRHTVNDTNRAEIEFVACHSTADRGGPIHQ